MTQLKTLFFFFALFSLFTANAQSFDQTLLKADSLFENGDPEKACELYHAASTMKPKEARPFKGMAYCYFNAGDYEKCISTIDQALKRKPELSSEYHLYYLKGACYYQFANWGEATKYFSKFLSMNFDRYDVFVQRGFAYFSNEKYKEAIADFEYALKDPQFTASDKANAYALMGTCYLNLEKTAEATKYSELAYSYDPLNTNALILKGWFAYEAGNFKEAFPHYQNVYIEDSTNSFALFRMAYCLTEMKQYDKATESYKAYLRLEPDSRDIYNQLAWNLFLAGKYEEALPYANKNVEINKDDANSYDTRGCIYYGLKEYGKAIADLTTSITKNNKSDNSYYYRALGYIQLKKNKEACMDLKKVLEFPEFQTPEGESPAQELIKSHCKN